MTYLRSQFEHVPHEIVTSRHIKNLLKLRE